MFVKAHAASNCKEGLSSLSRQCTRIGNIPDFIRSSIGGLRSLESSFLAACTALNCIPWLSLEAFCTIASKEVFCTLKSPSTSESSQISSWGTFLLFRRCSSLLFFLNSTTTSFLCLLIVSRSRPLFLKFFSRWLSSFSLSAMAGGKVGGSAAAPPPPPPFSPPGPVAL